MTSVDWAAVAAGLAAVATLVTGGTALAEYLWKRRLRKYDAVKAFVGWANPQELAIALYRAFVECGKRKDVREAVAEAFVHISGETEEDLGKLRNAVDKLSTAMLKDAGLGKTFHKMCFQAGLRRIMK